MTARFLPSEPAESTYAEMEVRAIAFGADEAIGALVEKVRALPPWWEPVGDVYLTRAKADEFDGDSAATVTVRREVRFVLAPQPVTGEEGPL